MKRNIYNDILFGVAVADALGVPVEFTSRQERDADPVTNMREYGTHRQPKGTWSDDSSLMFCLAEMLCGDYDLKVLADKMISWETKAYWTPHGEVFDKGIATSTAIWNMRKGIDPVLAGGNDEQSNGNGSLMRILPLLFHIDGMNIEERWNTVKDVSSLTHRHIRSVLSCFIYLEIARAIVRGRGKGDAYQAACETVKTFVPVDGWFPEKERPTFERLLSGSIGHYAVDEIRSSGYVIHTLEASIWCLLNTGSYADAVRKAVNLGLDTDTTAAVTGGLAGLLYGWETIPGEWLSVIARKGAIEDLAGRLEKKYA